MAPDMSLFLGSVLLCCIVQPLTSLSYQETNSQKNTNYADDSYNTGPKWLNKHCQGQRQSPINIENHAVVNNNQSLVTFVNYKANILDYRTYKVHQSVSLILNSRGNEKLVIRRSDGGNISETEYILHSFHFHWNCTEHSIDSKRHALEVHFVHYNRMYEDVEQAAPNEGGLAVFAVLFELRDKNNLVLDILLDMIKASSSNSSSNLHHSAVSFNDLFPDPGFFVYHYDGSLTTVPCYQTVRWNVASKLNYVSTRQIMEFQRLYPAPIMMNCRRMQEISNRTVQEFAVKIFNVGGASIASWNSKLHVFTIFLTIYLSSLC